MVRYDDDVIYLCVCFLLLFLTIRLTKLALFVSVALLIALWYVIFSYHSTGVVHVSIMGWWVAKDARTHALSTKKGNREWKLENRTYEILKYLLLWAKVRRGEKRERKWKRSVKNKKRKKNVKNMSKEENSNFRTKISIKGNWEKSEKQETETQDTRHAQHRPAEPCRHQTTKKREKINKKRPEINKGCAHCAHKNSVSCVRFCFVFFVTWMTAPAARNNNHDYTCIASRKQWLTAGG